MLVLGVLYLTAVFVFWAKPDNAPGTDWKVYRWLFVVAVLLPSVLDIGVATKNKDEEYWWNPQHTGLTVAYHAFHILGWIIVSVVILVIGRRFGKV